MNANLQKLRKIRREIDVLAEVIGGDTRNGNELNKVLVGAEETFWICCLRFLLYNPLNEMKRKLHYN